MPLLEKKAGWNHAASKLVNGFMDRSVMKGSTVMSAVYGGTYIHWCTEVDVGEKIKEKARYFRREIVEGQSDDIYAARGYLASVTMGVMGEYSRHSILSFELGCGIGSIVPSFLSVIMLWR